MKISIFGLGYVGIVTAAILSQKFKIIGVDINPIKVELVNQGKSPIIEEKISEYIKNAVDRNNLIATIDTRNAILESDVSIICVGTPSDNNGHYNLSSLESVLKNIIEILKEKNSYHCIIIRSTIPPGTIKKLITNYVNDQKIGICFNPEFLREGMAVSDYLDPPFIIAACSDEQSKNYIRKIYEDITQDIIFLQFEEAEIIKIISNVFHALKVVFANEIGRFCDTFEINGKRVMEIFSQDNKLNISKTYLKPGFAFGGSCLPKELRSFNHLAKINDIKIPVISQIEVSNRKHIEYYINIIESYKKNKLGFIGLSFKKGTDDMRESPYLLLVEYFIGKGYDLKIYDEDIILGKLMGTNKAYLEKEIPHISSLLVNNLKDLDDCEILITRNKMSEEFIDKIIITLN